VLVQEGLRDPVEAIDAKTGKREKFLPADGWADAPVVRGNLAYFHGRGGLVARNILTGDVEWRVLMDVSLLSPIVPSKDLVFVPQTLNGADFTSPTETSWVGFDAKNGLKRLELRADANAALAANDDVAVTFENGDLCAYSVGDGKERWRSTIPATKPLMIEGGRVFARTGDELGVFAASTGALQKRIDLGGTDAFGWFRPRLVARGAVVAWIESSVLNVADASTGKTMWRHEGAEELALAPSIAIAGHHDVLEGLDSATGVSKWKLTLDGRIDSISADGDTVVVRRTDGEITVVDAISGKVRFDVDLSAPPSESPEVPETPAPAPAPPKPQ
jgi:outer membrane protein assembly factor BamB